MLMYRSKSRSAFANEDELSPPRLVTYVKFVDNEMRSHLYRGRWLGLPWLLNDVIDRRGEWALVRFMPWSQLFLLAHHGAWNGDAERSLQRKISITLPKDSPPKVCLRKIFVVRDRERGGNFLLSPASAGELWRGTYFHFWLDSTICYEKRLFSELRTLHRNPYLKAVDYVIHGKLHDSWKTTWFMENYVIHVGPVETT